MKFILLLITFFLCVSYVFSQSPNENKDMYKKKGHDWPGLCNTGYKQSPINIIEGVNTEADTSYVEFSYVLPQDAADKKLYYDGDRVYMDINLGNITYYNKKGAKEVYSSNKIEMHFPAEHYVTIDGQTPRYALEMQLVHTLLKTDNLVVTNEKMKVKKAIVSLLFTVGDLTEGDIFLNQLGISKYNTDDKGSFLITPKSNYIDRKKIIPATFGVGFNYIAFQGLLNLINSDQHMFFYYGSETTPPCKEEVLWMVFAQPRSMAKAQFDYLLLMLAKNKNPDEKITAAKTPNMLYGNKRALVLYDDTLRGKILSNPLGLKHIKGKTFFRKIGSDPEI